MTAPRDRLLLTLVLSFVALTTLFLRGVHNARLGFEPVPAESSRWWSTDPDSQYHMRRLARLLEEDGPVAERDDYLNAPFGSAIPWPPYYTYTLAACLSPWLGAAPDRTDSDGKGSAAYTTWRLRLEHGVGYMPALFATLTAILVGLATFQLVRSKLGALAAGSLFAWTNASIQYSAVAVGDHHAFVTFLMVALFTAFAAAMSERNRFKLRAAWIYGVLCGFLAGWLLGSWVGGLMYIILVQAALGLALLSKRNRPALVPLGFSFHLVALITILPAILSSPWREEVPWIVVNLSWFHLLELSLGLAVFIPLLLFPNALNTKTTLRQRYPLLVAAALILGSAAAWLLQTPVAKGIEEGFAWAGRSNQFMGFINESQPLVNWEDGNFSGLFKYLGYAVLLLPFAWLAALRMGWKFKNGRSLIWLLAAPVLLSQSLVQRRFADNVAPLMAILLGWAVALFFQKLCAGKPARRRMFFKAVGALLVIAIAPLLNPFIAENTVSFIKNEQRYSRGPGAHQQRGVREGLEWLRMRELARPKLSGPGTQHRAVLANWERGHAVEWIADLPSVATNFGLYVGLDSYLSPWRFLLGSDPKLAEGLLLERQARYVLITSRYFQTLSTSIEILSPEQHAEYYRHLNPEQNVNGVQPALQLMGPWYASIAARLIFLGKLPEQLAQQVQTQLSQQGQAQRPGKNLALGQSLDFLRAIYVSPRLVKQQTLPHSGPPYPSCSLWERVLGAQLEHSGGTLEVEIDLAWSSDRQQPGFQFIGRAEPDADGFARLRVPYATENPSGGILPEGQVRVMGARWRSGSAGGPLLISEVAVQSGAPIALP